MTCHLNMQEAYLYKVKSELCCFAKLFIRKYIKMSLFERREILVFNLIKKLYFK